MNKFKKCNVIILPNKGEAKIGSIYKAIKAENNYDFDYYIGKLVINRNPLVCKTNNYWEAQHLYICSDDKYIEGDYIYSIDKVRKASLINCEKQSFKKIIATTDKILNLPEIPEQFLKEFCDKGGIQKVVVEYIQEKRYQSYKGFDEIWLNEEKKLFKLDSEAEHVLKWHLKLTNNIINIRSLKQNYTREEVEEFCRKAYNSGIKSYYTGSMDEDVNTWIEQNLK